MQPQLRRRFVWSIFTVLTFLAATTFAARRGGAVDGGTDVKIAQVRVSPHLVSFEPLVDYASMSLTVSGRQGTVFQGEFAAGSPMAFDLFDQAGNALADGTYVYELKATPRIAPEILQAMRSAREAGGDAEAEERLRDAGILPKLGASMTISGAFTIADGAVVDPDLPEGDAARPVDPGYQAGNVAPQDFVINDDLIVTGSACVGFDCTNGLAFGFDTLILKENNLRLFFDDTSNSASFPQNDWRLTANDSTNGGLSRFSIDDASASRSVFTIEAGARSNALYVEADGDIGIGTNNPVVDLEIVTGNTPTLRLTQDASSGFAAQTWDIAGNETNFFVRDVSNGSTLPFRIRPGAPTSAIDIDGDGNVGIGTSSPSQPLHVRRTNATARLLVEEANATDAARTLLALQNNGNTSISLQDTSTGSGAAWRFTRRGDNSTFVMTLDGSGGDEVRFFDNGRVQMGPAGATNFDLMTNGNLTIAGMLSQNSDRNSKNVLGGFNSGEVLRKVVSLPLSFWQMKTDTGAMHFGPMAQDFYGLFGLGADDRHISPLDLAAMAVAAVQGLNETVEAKDARIADLEARLAALEALVAQVSKQKE